jgi:regulatory protein SIR4/RNA polymerase II-associated factor 1
MDTIKQRVYQQDGGKKSSKKTSKKSSKKSSKKTSKKTSKKSSKKTSKKCSKGEILREGYKTKTGKKVSSGCIKAQSATGKKTSKELKKYIEKKESKQKQARQKFPKEASSKCDHGQIKREGYYTKSHLSRTKTGKEINVKGHWVAPGCINSVLGRSTKGSKLITLIEKDVLKKFGYKNIESMTKTDRQKALKKAINSIKPLSIYRRIIAIATLNKNKDAKLYKILREDAKWIKTQPEYIKQKSSKKSSK